MKIQKDEDLFALMREELYSAVIGDIMDKMGYFHQFLPARIQALTPDMVLVGRAMPVLEADCFLEKSPSGHNPLLSRPFGLMLEALDDLRKNEVYICTGSSPIYSLWGELMTARALMCGAAGAVLDGYIRDTDGIIAQKFPTFSYGSYAQDQGPRGKVIDYRVPIEIQGVVVNPGDIIFGDRDGVCVVPAAIEKEVAERALEKARGEKTILMAIKDGMSAQDAFDKYGIM